MSYMFYMAEIKGCVTRVTTAEAGLEVGGSESAYRSTALSLPFPDGGTNIMFKQMRDCGAVCSFGNIANTVR
jgi:hypothetical protein